MRWGKEDTSRKKGSIPVLVKGSCVLERGAGKAPSEANQTGMELFLRGCSECPGGTEQSLPLDHCCSRSLA